MKNNRLAVLTFLGLASIPAFGSTIHNATQVGSFTCVNPPGTYCTAGTFGQFQLYVNQSSSVFELGILNNGPVASSLHEIYFDTGTTTLVSGIAGYSADLTYNPATTISYTFPSGSPSNLPGSPMSFTSDFMLDANPPPATSGLNPGEAMWVRFTTPLPPLTTAYSQLLLALNGGVDGFRVGIHVGGFPDGSSQDGISYFSCPSCSSGDVPTVPEPGTWAMLAGGIAMISLGRRKLRNS